MNKYNIEFIEDGKIKQAIACLDIKSIVLLCRVLDYAFGRILKAEVINDETL